MLPPFFHQTPFFRLLLPFIAGIMFGFRFAVPAGYCILFCGLCITTLGAILWKKLRKPEWMHGVVLNLFLFSVGVASISLRAYTSILEQEHGIWLIVVEEPPIERTNSIRAIVNVRIDENEKARNERIMTYFRKDSLSSSIKQGDMLLINANISPVTNAGNPHEFDYKKYLARRNVGRSAFVESEQWKHIDSYAQSPLFNFSNRIRNNLLEILRRSGLSGNELAVVSALTLGYRADIDDELRRAYSASGAMHVLAVSGLHVGIVYMALNTVLLLFPFLNRAKWLRAIIQLTALWMFALITGLSPSVMRAATMFSFIAVGDALRRRAYIYNSIAASAFILLLVNPYNLLEVGFQFSYMAVIAIVYLHPMIYKLLNFRNIVLDKTWNLACVSIAAQAGVSPLAIYYFHQFPTYFVFTNFIVIPAATIIIYGAIFMFIISPFTVLFEVFGWLFDKFMYIINFMIFFIEKLPGSVILNIRFAQWEIILAYILIAAVGAWMLVKHKFYLFVVLVAIVFWTAGATVRTSHELRRQKLIIYNCHGNSLIQFISGHENTVVYSSRNPTFNAGSFLKNQRTAMQLANCTYFSMDSAFRIENRTFVPPIIFSDGNFIKFGNKRIAVFTRNEPPQYADSLRINIDLAILTQNVNANIIQIIESYNPEIIIIDASNSTTRANNWENECIAADVKFHRVDKSGAFVLNL